MSNYMELAGEYMDSSIWSAPISPESNKFLATNHLLLTVFLLVVAFLDDKTTLAGNLKFLAISLAASIAIGFGSVFAANYVGVYV